MICPRCEQGNITTALINCSGKKIYLCEECEAMWFPTYAIDPNNFIDFNTYMRGIGRKPLWSELTIVGEEILTPKDC